MNITKKISENIPPELKPKMDDYLNYLKKDRYENSRDNKKNN